jgi:hypothetical protein
MSSLDCCIEVSKTFLTVFTITKTGSFLELAIFLFSFHITMSLRIWSSDWKPFIAKYCGYMSLQFSSIWWFLMISPGFAASKKYRSE